MIYKFTIPIIRKDFNKTESAKFKGDITFICNKDGIIYDWKINFKTLFLDQYTTPSWFIKKTKSKFKWREILFDKLGLKQIKRPPDKSNKLIELNDEQIEIVNDFLNNRETYNSTIKNIVGVLKGNSPVGEFSKAKAAEMIMDTEDKTLSNFAILIDDLIINSLNESLFDVYDTFAKEIKLGDFVKLNEYLEKVFKYMQKDKNQSEIKIYLTSIEDYVKKYKVDIKKANSIINSARRRFSENVDKQISLLPFDFKSKDQFQKAHIVQVQNIKDKIIYSIRENKSYDEYIQKIEDPNNFLPLPESIHRKFDANYFTYKDNGDIYAINEEGYKFINDPELLEPKYKHINDFFLNEKRKEYIRERNENIPWDE